MLSANQIAGILNKLFAEQNDETASFSKLTKTQKIFGGRWSKMGMANMASGL